jgi:WD40 repeat protein
LAYSPDGHAAASAANATVTIWNPRSATPREVLTAPGGQVQQLTFNPDGHRLYTSAVGGLVLEWDLTGKASFGERFVLGRPLPCCDPVAPLAPSLAILPDGSTFAVRLGASTVGLFSALTLQPRESFTVKPKGAVITALAWSPTAPPLAVGGHSGLVQLWRVDGTPRLARSLSGLQPVLGQLEAIQAIAFSPDGRLIAASDAGETRGYAGYLPQCGLAALHVSSLAIWRTDSGKLAAPIDLATGLDPFDPIAFSPDGRVLGA